MAMLEIAQMQEQLRAQAAAIEAMVRDIPPARARWKPDPESWSILEVINHLADEERDDFRRRVDLTLHEPEADWPPIDPPGWVVERRYNERDLAESVRSYTDERARSLEWLGQLRAPNWDNTHSHPLFGAMSAGQVMAGWLAHDLLHLRQLVELRYQYLAQMTRPYSLEYAGGW